MIFMKFHQIENKELDLKSWILYLEWILGNFSFTEKAQNSLYLWISFRKSKILGIRPTKKPVPGIITVLFWSILEYGTKTAPEIMAPETGRNGSTSYERSF